MGFFVTTESMKQRAADKAARRRTETSQARSDLERHRRSGNRFRAELARQRLGR